MGNPFKRSHTRSGASGSPYREIADQYHGEWVSNELTGTEETEQDRMQGALARREWAEQTEQSQ